MGCRRPRAQHGPGDLRPRPLQGRERRPGAHRGRPRPAGRGARARRAHAADGPLRALRGRGIPDDPHGLHDRAGGDLRGTGAGARGGAGLLLGTRHAQRRRERDRAGDGLPRHPRGRRRPSALCRQGQGPRPRGPCRHLAHARRGCAAAGPAPAAGGEEEPDGRARSPGRRRRGRAEGHGAHSRALRVRGAHGRHVTGRPRHPHAGDPGGRGRDGHRHARHERVHAHRRRQQGARGAARAVRVRLPPGGGVLGRNPRGAQRLPQQAAGDRGGEADADAPPHAARGGRNRPRDDAWPSAGRPVPASSPTPP